MSANSIKGQYKVISARNFAALAAATATATAATVITTVVVNRLVDAIVDTATLKTQRKTENESNIKTPEDKTPVVEATASKTTKTK